MAKWFRKVQVVEAVQWFPGVEIPGLYTEANKPGQAFTIDAEDGEPNWIHPGDWAVRGDDLVVRIYTDENFRKLYEPVFPGINRD